MTPLAVGGTVLWLIAGAVMTLFADDLAASGRSWWIDCAWWGAAVGIPGIITMVVHDRRRRRSTPQPSRSSVADTPAAEPRLLESRISELSEMPDVATGA
jgi:hypothetical protein